jgi:hypothetical protein
MKRYLIAGAVGTMVFGAALGSAAALNIKGNPVAQYGDSGVTCDTNGITVEGFRVDSEPPSSSTGIVLSDIAPACNGKTIVATITDDEGTMLRRAYGPVDGQTKTLLWNKIELSEIEGVQLTLG